MGLPKIASKQYKTNLPSDGSVINFRPYLAKEERLLLEAAQEDTSPLDQFRSIMTVIQACVLDDGFSAEDMYTIDFEYVYLQLRGKSVGEESTLTISCENPECEHKQEVSIDFTDVEVKAGDDHTLLVKFFEDDDSQETVAIQFEMPRVKTIVDDPKMIEEAGLLNLIQVCMRQVWVGESSYTGFSSKEALEFVESLTVDQFNHILDVVFNQMPRVRKEITFTCEECGTENTFHLEGMQSFFG